MANGAVVIPGATALSEWFSPVAGAIAGCGQAAVLVVTHLLHGEPLSAAELTAAIQQGVAAGQTVSPSGATTAANLQWLGAQHGVQFTEGPGSGWQGVLNANAGTTPVVVGVNNASAFGGSDTGVQGHYVTVVGKTGTGGYLVADPNSPQAATGGLVTYTADQFAAANPFATLTPTGTTGTVGSTQGLNIPGVGDVAGAISGLPASVGKGILGAFGAKSGADLAWRVGLVLLGGILLVWALLHIFEPTMRGAGDTVIAAGATAAKAAAA